MNIKITEIGTQRQLKEIDVTRATLKQIVEALYYNCEVMPNGILCVEGIDVPRPIWITLDPEQHLITLEVFDWPPPYSDGKDLAVMLNTLNANVRAGEKVGQEAAA